jgi:hypothetical protein
LAILDVNINELLSDMQSDTYDYKIGNIDSVKKSVSSAIYNKLQDCSVQIDIDDFAIIKNIIDKQAIRNDRFNDIKNINTLIKLSNNRTKVLELFNQTIRQGWDFLRPLKDEMIQALEKYEESKFKSRSALERTLLEFEDKIETINKDLGRYNLKYKVSKTTIDTVTTKYKQRRSLVESSLVLEHIISGKEVKESEFEETLSEGEKSVLVWTLFIHQIKRSLGSSNTILIIDDPIASYDNFRRFPMLYDIKTLISLNPNLRCIVLTHEKSFASVFEMLSSFHLYLMKSNSLEKVNIYEIKQNELVYLIHRIKEIMSDPVIDINNIVEMFVSFRKVIELDQEIMTKTNILSGRHEMAFNDISKMLHCESNDIYKVTRKFLCKLYEKQLGEKCPITKMRTTYDILTIAKANLNNPYSSRIVVEEYLRQFLTIEQKKKTLTIGQTFNLVKDKIDQEKRINIANSLAVINSVFHSGKGVGLSYREIEEYEVQKLIALSNSI